MPGSNPVFRNWITSDGAPGPTGDGGFAAASGRYHLYVSHSCPWAHRTVILRQLKGLEDLIGLSVTHWRSGENGWTFEETEGVIADPILDARFIHQLYSHADDSYSGRVTVPILWDKEKDTIVSNESSEIIRMFNVAFDDLPDNRIRRDLDFYPEQLRAEIDEINALVYETVNNGVYRSGFAKSQEAYDDGVARLFATLDRIEERLGTQRYLVGGQVTEADWRLFTTLVRFDLVYHGHFKCNRQRIQEYANLENYLRELYQMPGIAETCDLHHMKSHYYGSHESINPTRIVPVGPEIHLDGPHDRDRLPAES